MSTVVFFGDRPEVAVDALKDSERLLIDPDELETVTGWTLKPEGLCREEASVQGRREAALDVQAPDFTLPDLDGDLHSLSDYRGQKIFLLAWGSY